MSLHLWLNTRMKFYGHSHPDFPEQPDKWEPLFTEDCGTLDGKNCSACENLDPNHGHLNKVAYLAGRFAAEMFPAGSKESVTANQWGKLAGWTHDLGKFSLAFQERLRGNPARVDHSTAGAKWFAEKKPYGPLMAYLIAGHHAGLPDAASLFHERFKAPIPEWKTNAQPILSQGLGDLPMPPLTRKVEMFEVAFMARMFFSCLVDADYLATESFMEPQTQSRRLKWPSDIISQMRDALDVYYHTRFKEPATEVEHARNNVRSACQDKATLPAGFFSLTVPTGGGKTLASLDFALRHAEIHGMRRIIYAIPYTSIIEQNADVFRDVFMPLSEELNQDVVLEHHSNFESEKATQSDDADVWRKTAENWNAPLIATTNVQFLESLFANKTSRCRKLHNTARSVIILDEAQALPLQLLAPILRALTCLVKDFGCSVVFCTATQPALGKRDDFKIGIPAEEIREIMPDPAKLHRSLRRVRTESLGALPDADLLHEHLLPRAADGALLVVNTTTAARDLHQQISEHTKAFHLSGRMCPAHRRQVLAEVKLNLDHGSPCVLVSTQLIEAGVDVSFPVVYRAECGIDSLAQAAGRCNRHGEWGVGPDAKGQAFFFEPVDHPIPGVLGELRRVAGVTRAHILDNFPGEALLSLNAIESFFRQSFWLQGGDHGKGWDQKGILECFPAAPSLEVLQFASAAEKFEMISQNTRPVIIPWGLSGGALAIELRDRNKSGWPPTVNQFRRAQQFTVQVYPHEWESIRSKCEILHEGAIAILSSPDDYDSDTGLKPGNSASLLHVG